MSQLQRRSGCQLISDEAVHRWSQYFCFAMAPLLLMLAIRAVTRMATTPFEILLGVLAAGTLAMLMVVMGFVMPLTQRRDA